MRFRINEDHIKEGQRLCSECCPVALRLRETSRGKKVSVAGTEIVIGRVRYRPEHKLTMFIRNFDSREVEKCKPGVYEMTKIGRTA